MAAAAAKSRARDSLRQRGRLQQVMQQARQPLAEKLYRGGRRILRRLHVQRLLDYSWSEIMLAKPVADAVSSWDLEGLWMGELWPHQLAWLADLAPERAREFPQRWAEGRRCFAAILDESGQRRCVSYVWVAPGPTALTSREFGMWSIPAGVAWFFEAYSHPLVIGTYPDLSRFAHAQLRQQGYIAIIGRIEFDNRRSRRMHQRLGARRLGGFCGCSSQVCHFIWSTLKPAVTHVGGEIRRRWRHFCRLRRRPCGASPPERGSGIGAYQISWVR